MGLYAIGLGGTQPPLLPSAIMDRFDPLRQHAREIGKTRGIIVGLHKRGAYHNGIRGAPHETVGQWVATPAYIKGEVRRLFKDAQSVGRELAGNIERLGCSPLTRDASACGRLNDFIINVWTPYMTELHVFSSQHDQFFENFWGSTIDEVNTRRDKLVKLRASAQLLGAEFVGPTPEGAKKSNLDEIGEGIVGIIKLLIITAAVAFGLYGIAKLIMEYRS